MAAGPVIIGVSGTAASFHAARAAREVYGRGRRYLLVMNVAQLHDDDGRTNRILDDAAAVLAHDADRRIVVGGRPGPALCEVAATTGAGAIVVGARPEPMAWTHPVVGHVLRRAPCPVLLAVLTER